MINKLNSNQLKDLRISGKILATALKEVAEFVKPGVTTQTLDEVAERALRRLGATPSFKNYYVENAGRFPAALCVSVNDELVHGIPNPNKVLKVGDIISLDLGANYKGTFTDMAVTVSVGQISATDKKLIEVTKNSLSEAINFLRPGVTTGDLGNFIENYVKKSGFVVIRDLVGHGIGLAPHEEPQIPNFGERGAGIVLEEGMTIAIEPMVAIENHEVKTQKDGWTIKMLNGKNCAHFEHTVLITKSGAEIITKL